MGERELETVWVIWVFAVCRSGGRVRPLGGSVEISQSARGEGVVIKGDPVQK
jgi:hypothetical protein